MYLARNRISIVFYGEEDLIDPVAAFYETCGLTVIEKNVFRSISSLLRLAHPACDGAQLTFWSPRKRPSAEAEIEVSFADIEPIAQRLENAGIPYKERSSLAGSFIHCIDPAGNSVTLSERPPETPMDRLRMGQYQIGKSGS